MTTGFFEIALVAAAILGAVAFLAFRAYRRFATHDISCGGCGGACGGQVENDSRSEDARQVVSSINLLTHITAQDRGL